MAEKSACMDITSIAENLTFVTTVGETMLAFGCLQSIAIYSIAYVYFFLKLPFNCISGSTHQSSRTLQT